jgi:hypothetical protein
METITARLIWTADDLLAGRKHALKLNKWTSFGFWAAFVVFVSIGISVSGPSNSQHRVLAASIIGGVILVGILIGVPLAKMISRWLIRRQFAKRPDAGSEVVWEISENGIATHSAHSKAEIQWDAFQRVVSTPAGFLFMPNAQIFHFLPNRAFADDGEMDKVRDLARRLAKEFKEIR